MTPQWTIPFGICVSMVNVDFFTHVQISDQCSCACLYFHCLSHVRDFVHRVDCWRAKHTSRSSRWTLRHGRNGTSTGEMLCQHLLTETDSLVIWLAFIITHAGVIFNVQRVSERFCQNLIWTWLVVSCFIWPVHCFYFYAQLLTTCASKSRAFWHDSFSFFF